MNSNDFQQCTDYLQPYLEGELDQLAGSLELRLNMVAFLHFIQQNKIIGTKSTGNMPLKMISQLSKELTNPPKLEYKIGEKIYKVRSETEVWAIYFPHILAEGGHLVKISPSKQWKLAPTGINFLEAPALIQLWFLLMIWWHTINWLVAFPVIGIGENLPYRFELITLDLLRLIADNDSMSFYEFADSLIKNTDLTWTSQDTTYHQKLLRGAIEHIVINILAQFGVFETEYVDDFIGKYKTKKLKSFKFTRLGRTLIEAIRLSFV